MSRMLPPGVTGNQLVVGRAELLVPRTMDMRLAPGSDMEQRIREIVREEIRAALAVKPKRRSRRGAR